MPDSLDHNPGRDDADRHFRTDHLHADLKGHSVRGGFTTLAAQGCKFVLTLGSTAVLARILAPDDFGLLAMVIAVTGFLERLKGLGLAASTVQRTEINHQQVTMLFWVNAAFGLILAAALVASAPAIVWLYGEVRLGPITTALAIGFVFSGLCIQHQALLRRQMRFIALAGIDVVSTIAGVAVGIAAAWRGAGYWALVAMYLTIELTRAVSTWVICRWRPGLPRRGGDVRSMLAFGGYLTAFNIVNHLERSLDKILIGAYLGAGPLGLFAKGYQLLLVPTQQINTPLTRVIMPGLSRLQHEAERYRAYFRQVVQLIVAAGMPLVVFMFVDAEVVILTILGNQWTEAVPIFRVLAPAALLGTFEAATGWVFVSRGEGARQFRWGIASAVVMGLGFAVGLRWGVLGVAAACSIGTCVLRLPAVAYCFKSTPLAVSDLLGVLWRPALASLAAGAALFVAPGLGALEARPLLALPIDLSIYAVAYVLIWTLLPNGRRTMRTTFGLLDELRRAPQVSVSGAETREG